MVETCRQIQGVDGIMTDTKKSKLWEAFLNVPEDSVLRTDALQCQSEMLANKVMAEGTEILTDLIKLAVAERFAKVHDSSSIAYKYRVDIGVPKDFWNQVLSFLTINVEPTMPFEEICNFKDTPLTQEI